jgi:hypothetical protein
MHSKGRLAAILVVLALFGCKGSVTTSAASAAEGAGTGAAPGPSSGAATRVENIVDPTLDNKTAYSVTIPQSGSSRRRRYQDPRRWFPVAITVRHCELTNPEQGTLRHPIH